MLYMCLRMLVSVPLTFTQETVSISLTALATLEAEANSGHFNLGNLTVNETGVGYPTLSADCPPGTLFVNTHTTTVFSCGELICLS